MIPAARQQAIIEHLMKSHNASINDLTMMLGVSHMTVRRDVQKLEQMGWVDAVAGGVSLASSRQNHETPLLDKWHSEMSRQKQAIAAEAVSLIFPGATVFLDAGTTCLALARQIAKGGKKYEQVLIATNDLVIASYLAEDAACRLFIAGGAVERETRSCVGSDAGTMLKTLNIDLAFIAPIVWNSEWISVPNADKAFVKKSVSATAGKKILIGDSSKFGKSSAFRAMPLSIFDTVISDDGLSVEARDLLRATGIELRLASVNAITDS